MEAKIRVVVCVGTACYVLGGAELLEIEERMPASLKDRIELEGRPCMGLCSGRGADKPPFATVDGLVVAGATVESLAAAIEAAARKGDAAAGSPEAKA